MQIQKTLAVYIETNFKATEANILTLPSPPGPLSDPLLKRGVKKNYSFSLGGGNFEVGDPPKRKSNITKYKPHDYSEKGSLIT